ncbi:MAG: hypothetical protein HRU28_00165 [Rhizobiales bacterium]|nr:hypothetical protein [Hyphomicrobiales bacterium]
MNNCYCIKNSNGLLFASAAFGGGKVTFTNYLAMARLYNSRISAEVSVKRNGLEAVKIVTVSALGEVA